MNLVKYLDGKWYPEFQDNWDDKLFRDFFLHKLKESSKCLDFGAGRGNVRAMHLDDVVAFVAGVDVDSAVYQNKHLHEAKVIDLDDFKIPYDNCHFDFVISDNVMEHIDDPCSVLSEICRVLKPGGSLFIKTPNRNHYMPIISRITPTWFHRYYNQKRGRKELDTFPVRYKLNTLSAIMAHSKSAGMIVNNVTFVEGRPEYLRLNSLTYFLGFLYERFVNSSKLFSSARCVIMAEIGKEV